MKIMEAKCTLSLKNRDKVQKGALSRGDRAINLCEMEFSIGPYIFKKSYAIDVRKRMQLFKEKEKVSYGLISTFVTTFGVADGVNREVVDSEVTAEDLFS